MAGNRQLNQFRRIGIAFALPLVIFVGVFIALPTLNIISGALHWGAFSDALGDDRIRHVLWITVWQASWSTFVAAVIGFPLAVVLAHHSFRGKRVVAAAFSLPFVLPTVVIALAAVSLSGGSHPLITIVMTHAYFNVSVVVRVVRSHLQSTVTTFNNAAATLGAGPFERLRTIDLPIARKSLTSAMTMVFVFCVTSFGVVRIIGGISATTTEVEIFIRAIQLGDMPTAVALSVMQIVFLLLVVAFFRPTAPTLRSSSVASEYQRALDGAGRFAMWLVGCLFAVPVVVILLKSVRTGGSWSTAGWHGIDNGVLVNSLKFAAGAAVLASLLSVAAVMAVAHAGHASRVVNAFASIPVIVSSIILSVGVVSTFNTGWYDFRGSAWLLPVMHAVVALPVSFRILRGPIERLTSEHRDAAATLGASPWTVIATVDLRALRRGLLPMSAVAACISLGEFGAASVLSRSGSRTVPLEISRLLGRPGDTNQLQAYALASILMITVAVIMVTLGERDA